MKSLVNKIIKFGEQFPEKLALNGHTYGDLRHRLFRQRGKKTGVVAELMFGDERNILGILEAASREDPVVIWPHNNKTKDLVLPNDIPLEYFTLTIFSSGTTGVPKAVTQSSAMILKNIENAIECQNIRSFDCVYTVSSVAHAGGIHAQTLAALSVGATVVIEPFSAYRFLRKSGGFTLTHLVPDQVRALMLTKGWSKFSRQALRLVACGSDRVTKELAETFVEKGIPFLINYGMSEAGPIILNHKFDDLDEVKKVYRHGTPLGSRRWCECKIVDGELYLRGQEVYQDGWVATGDEVFERESVVYFKGRKC